MCVGNSLDRGVVDADEPGPTEVCTPTGYSVAGGVGRHGGEDEPSVVSDEAEASGAMVLYVELAEIEFLLEGVMVRIWRHVDCFHVRLADEIVGSKVGGWSRRMCGDCSSPGCSCGRSRGSKREGASTGTKVGCPFLCRSSAWCRWGPRCGGDRRWGRQRGVRCGGGIIRLKSEVVQELCRGWAGWLEIPHLVKGCVVTGFYDAAGGVEVLDILVGGGVPEEDACVVVAIKFAAPLSWCLDADARAEGFEVGDVRLTSVPGFIGRPFSGRVDESVMKID